MKFAKSLFCLIFLMIMIGILNGQKQQTTDPKVLNHIRESMICKALEGEDIFDFCKRVIIKGKALAQEEERLILLFFMLLNAGTIQTFQGILLHKGESFFFRDTRELVIPELIPIFELGEIGYYKNYKLEDNWIWDEKECYTGYDATAKRLEMYYRGYPQYDEIGVANYSVKTNGRITIYYRVVMHKRG
jgi:hypothetical protein